jgi:hypothetical protein
MGAFAGDDVTRLGCVDSPVLHSERGHFVSDVLRPDRQRTTLVFVSLDGLAFLAAAGA